MRYSITSDANMLQTGQTSPDFTLPDGNGTPVTLSDQRPTKVVLYFYPKDDTPGCTTEALDFTAMAADFVAADTVVFGISRDSVASHAKFSAKHDLTVRLLSDEDGTVCEAYGVWVEKKNYGRTYMGIERTTVLIDGAGQIAEIWNKVRVKGHADAVLKAAQAL